MTQGVSDEERHKCLCPSFLVVEKIGSHNLFPKCCPMHAQLWQTLPSALWIWTGPASLTTSGCCSGCASCHERQAPKIPSPFCILGCPSMLGEQQVQWVWLVCTWGMTPTFPLIFPCQQTPPLLSGSSSLLSCCESVGGYCLYLL